MRIPALDCMTTNLIDFKYSNLKYLGQKLNNYTFKIKVLHDVIECIHLIVSIKTFTMLPTISVSNK